jgi:TetR/AcrR family transcriptional regulator
MTTSRRQLAPESWPRDARGRLMATMAYVASERGYATTRVADVLEEAEVSRRTFYVYFDNREACFFATYDAIWEDVSRLIASRNGSFAPVLDGVLEHFAAWPWHAKLLLNEIYSAGPAGAERHERSMAKLAAWVAGCEGWQPGRCAALERVEAAQALVGAIVRIVQRELTGMGGQGLAELAPSLVALTRVSAARA